jgi:hypothetical protein
MTDIVALPSLDCTSKTTSSITMRPLSASDNVLSSSRVIPIEAPLLVSNISPENISEPCFKTIFEPSERVASAMPFTASIVPIGIEAPCANWSPPIA